MISGLSDLDDPVVALLQGWLPGAVLERDHSWPLGQRHVFEVRHEESLYAVKVGGPQDHHMAREIRAHHEWAEPWAALGRGPSMIGSDLDLGVVVTRWLPGRLVEGGDTAADPDSFRQAGELLALFHGQLSVVATDHERRETDRALSWLDRPHRIDGHTEARLRDELRAWDVDVTTTLCPTHGDWQPRNWLVHEGVVSVIDLGRVDLRPAATDFVRLAAQDFASDPALEKAFFSGYGDDPREEWSWRRMRLREAIGTATWAFQHGDEAFEQQGHHMIAEALGSL